VTDAANVLVLFAHPAIHRSRANRALRAAAEAVPGVAVHDLYESYPDFSIDVGAEQQRIAGCRALVLQHPLYWYAAPAMVKEWLDLVLTYGFAYGRKGDAIRGKPWLQVVTAAGSEEDYAPQGANRYAVTEFLRPFEATASLCGCRWESPFVVHDSRGLSADGLIAAGQAYAARLAQLASAT
jgi:glutathione-regulated potassium-efflux system ancillary protein KefG